jgi:tetratricopeptide (TPR) repeat protein
MAFGFGFNKQKVLSAAEKFVQQGKLQNAISEYEKILKHDAKDLTVMNTVGDLYSRLGETDKAAECFKNVGDAYASQGFTVKAIAMYKKLSKLKSSMECVLRLAELYTQQGLFNDARAQYLLVAEDFLKTGQIDQAARIFEKTLEMDPDNVAMRTKLAEVYIRLGKKDEAWQLLSAAAESLRGKGQLAAADEILQRMLKLDPGSSYALVLRGRSALDAGDAAAAIESLSKVADLDTNPEGLDALFHAYLRSKRFDEAGSLAAKLSSVHNNKAAIGEYADALLEGQEYREALNVYAEHADELLRNDPVKLSESLRAIIGHVQDDPQALEMVLALFQKSGENTHLSEVYELMAHAYVQSNDLEKARDCYLKLMQMEPANQIHVQNYQQVLEKMGAPNAPRQITAEEGSALVEEIEATAPFIEQHYNDELAMAVRAALTDAELFISYNMAQKALPPLLGALPKAPRDLRLNQKLAALHSRDGRFTEAAVCCRTLESIYRDAGHPEEASRYGELAAKYEERSAGTVATTTGTAEVSVVDSAASPATPEFEISAPVSDGFAGVAEGPPVAEPVPAAAKPSGPRGVFFHASTRPLSAPAPSIQAEQPSEPSLAPAEERPAEVDLSSEWENDLSVEAPDIEAPQVEVPQHELPEMAEAAEPQAEVVPPHATPVPAVNLEEGIEEVRFYLGQGMTDHAETALAKLEALAPGSPELAVLRLGIESAKQQAGDQTPAPEITLEEAMPAYETAAAEKEPASSAPQPWPQEPQRPAAEPPVLQQIVSELEQSLGSGFLPEAEPAKPEVPAAQAASSENQEFRSGTLDEFVSDLEASLGSDFAPEAALERQEIPVAQVQPPVAQGEVSAAAAASIAHVNAPVARAAAASAMQMPSAPAPVSPPVVHQPPMAAATSAVEFAPGVDLADMFGELKHELEEDITAVDEDPETHYNLGVAFREMGLLDEAIGEFQKVCQSTEHGRAFSQLMQTYTWLAQCFLDKGVPEAAIRWYEKALKLPSLDQETRTALHYELASSFENAGNKSAALSNFLEVYGSNIDYRDVGERIKALRP